MGALCKNLYLRWKENSSLSYDSDSKTIHNELSQVLIDPQDKLKHKIEAFQDYYMLSFNEGNLLSLLFFISTIVQALLSVQMLTDGATCRPRGGGFVIRK